MKLETRLGFINVEKVIVAEFVKEFMLGAPVLENTFWDFANEVIVFNYGTAGANTVKFVGKQGGKVEVLRNSH